MTHLNSLNKPNNFINLPKPVSLEVSWDIALTEHRIKTSSNDPIYVFSDICKD